MLIHSYNVAGGGRFEFVQGLGASEVTCIAMFTRNPDDTEPHYEKMDERVYKRYLGLKDAKELVESFDPHISFPFKINAIKQLRSESLVAWWDQNNRGTIRIVHEPSGEYAWRGLDGEWMHSRSISPADHVNDGYLVQYTENIPDWLPEAWKPAKAQKDGFERANNVSMVQQYVSRLGDNNKLLRAWREGAFTRIELVDSATGDVLASGLNSYDQIENKEYPDDIRRFLQNNGINPGFSGIHRRFVAMVRAMVCDVYPDREPEFVTWRKNLSSSQDMYVLMIVKDDIILSLTLIVKGHAPMIRQSHDDWTVGETVYSEQSLENDDWFKDE